MPSAPPKDTIEMHLGWTNPLCRELLEALKASRDAVDVRAFRKITVTVGSQTWILMPGVEQKTISEGEESVLTFRLRAPMHGELT